MRKYNRSVSAIFSRDFTSAITRDSARDPARNKSLPSTSKNRPTFWKKLMELAVEDVFGSTTKASHNLWSVQGPQWVKTGNARAAPLSSAPPPKADFSGLNQLQSLHADMPVLADDDVIVHGYP